MNQVSYRNKAKLITYLFLSLFLPLLLCKIIIVLTIVVGVFKKEPSVRSCINVRDAVARLANGGDKYDAEYVPKEREKKRERERERI